MIEVISKRLVLVIWQDSLFHSGGWQKISAAESEETFIKTVGWILVENVNHISVHPSVNESSEDSFGSVMIPKAAVVSIIDLKVREVINGCSMGEKYSPEPVTQEAVAPLRDHVCEKAIDPRIELGQRSNLERSTNGFRCPDCGTLFVASTRSR